MKLHKTLQIGQKVEFVGLNWLNGKYIEYHETGSIFSVSGDGSVVTVDVGQYPRTEYRSIHRRQITKVWHKKEKRKLEFPIHICTKASTEEWRLVKSGASCPFCNEVIT